MDVMPKSAAAAYLERLQAPRCVLDEDGVLSDPTQSQQLRRGVTAVCRYYDFVERRFAHERFFCPGFIEPRSREDLHEKALLLGECARQSLGLMGRLPDFMNVVVTAIGAHGSFFSVEGNPPFKDNIAAFHKRAREGRLFLAHAAINPSPPDSDDPIRYDSPRVMDKTSDGVRISGAKRMSTMAPLADEILVFNMPGRSNPNADQQLAFTVPTTAEGLKIYCRRSVVPSEVSPFDSPLGSHFDESDALVVFDNVLIRWPDLFVLEDGSRSNGFYNQTFALNHAAHQGVIRVLAKLEFVVSLFRKLVGEFVVPARREEWYESLGSHVASYNALESLLRASMETSTLDSCGIENPNMRYLHTARLLAPEAYRALMDDIRRLTQGRSLGVPPLTALHQLLEFNSVAHDERADRLQALSFLNMAWDLAGTSFGARQVAYEFEHAGGAARTAKECLGAFDFTTGDSMVERARGLG